MKQLVLEDGAPEFEEEAFAMILAGDAFAEIAAQYAHFVLMPPLLAQRLRARGDRHASARDFECGCLTLAESDRPHCNEVFADCRFAGAGEAPAPDARSLMKKSPRGRILRELLIKIAATYKKKPPRDRTEMLALMTEAAEQRLRRIAKNRRPGKFLLSPPHPDDHADEA